MISNVNISPFSDLIKKLETQKAVLHKSRNNNNNNNGPDLSKGYKGNEVNAILVELSTVTFATAPLESTESNALLDVLQDFVGPQSKETKYALPILGNISKGAKLPTLQRIADMVKSVLINSTIPLNIAAGLKTIALLINENAKLANENMGMLLPIVYRSLFPTEEHSPLADSETEWSEHNATEDIPKQRIAKLKPEWKVQYHALFCLEALGRQCSKQLYHHLPKFISHDFKNHHSLLYFIQYHKSDQIRIMACKVLVSIFTDSKQYLSIAVNHSKKSSFTSLSQQIANQLIAIFDALINAFQSSTSVALLPDLCLVLNTFLINANLQNLNNNMDERILNLITDCLLDNVCSRGCAHLLLDCLASLMEKTVYVEGGQSVEEMHSSALSVALSFTKRAEPSIQISVFGVLASIASANPRTIREHWADIIFPFIQTGLQSSVHAINLSALKVLEHFAHSANAANLVLDVDWWKSVFEMTAHLWMLPVCNIRCISCNLISHVPETVFYVLEKRLVSLLITTVLAYMQDEQVDVRAASCGALGVLVGYQLYPSTIIHDSAIRLVELCDDTALKVRIRAFWALGALADAVRYCEENDSFSKTEELQQRSASTSRKHIVARLESLDLEDGLLLSILRVSIAGCSDHEKVRYHAFRALGRLAPTIPSHIMHQSLPLLNEAIANLVLNLSSGAFKTRWNACHCIRNLIACEGFPLGKIAPYSESLWSALVQVSLSSSNFKVKTGAILALSTPRSPARYESLQKTSDEMVCMILAGMAKVAKVCQNPSSSFRGSEEQLHVDGFLVTLQESLVDIKSSMSSSWSPMMEASCQEALENIQLSNGTVGEKSSFDPKGI